ncbi:DUF4209 domain-containing protein [Chryseobacterium jejuense]|uniref:DUF4209 domain-containing protein n=1 Tax=Chryseobacterium jejuense TaxID=445960 RepID=A0A2X2X8H8_CHRJE|nr:DUF4209 domain-containing protein [Chryseobacterium jejuense]SDI13971.1 protein of unknown function [Chryseobacterium jejuense]SQB46463.1 Uncharacterised protein [Chryseobacterium jejuense]
MSQLFTISEKIYLQELRSKLYKASQMHSENLEIKNLLELARCELADESLIMLSKSAEFKMPVLEIANIEMLARLNDLKFILGHHDKIQSVKIAVEFYQQLFDETNELKFFLRSIELVRKVKNLFLDVLSGYEKKALSVFEKLETSYCRSLLINSCYFLLQENSKETLINKSIDCLSNDYTNNEYSSAQHYITILNKLNYYDNNDYKIQNAICLEKEGDFHTSEKKINTYYPIILQAYTTALRELKSLPENEDFRNRLNKKIKIEQAEQYNVLTNSVINIKSEFDISKMMKNLNISDFQTGLSNLLQIPIIEEQIINKAFEQKGKSLFGQFFGNYTRISDKGTVSGITDEKNYYNNVLRDHYRKVNIGLILEIKSIMDNYEKLSKESILKLIRTTNSAFIPNGREEFFIEGIYSGFENNFILSSHLLIPQIENSLKNIIEVNGRNTTRLADDIQNDNTLGTILNPENKDKMLNGICNKDLQFELHNFLIDGSSTNFRNRICHGLASTWESNFYGIYLWWITLKMVLLTKDFFEIPERSSNIS